VAIVGPDGERLVYSGDTGPNETLIGAATGVDLLVVEATITSAAEDGPSRGHLTAAEAIAIGRQAGVGGLLLTHYPSRRRGALLARCALIGPPAWIARPGVQLAIEAGRPVQAVEPILTMAVPEAIPAGP
jgi:ribonuclease Z